MIPKIALALALAFLTGCAGVHYKTVNYISVPAVHRRVAAKALKEVRGYALSAGYREAESPLDIPPGYRASFVRERRQSFYEIINVKKFSGDLHIYLRMVVGLSNRENTSERLKLFAVLQGDPDLAGVRLEEVVIPDRLDPSAK